MSSLQKSLVIAAAAWHLAACGRIIGIEDLPEVAPDAAPPPVYTVRGTAVGLLAPVSVRLEHPDGFELLTVEQDGTFAFQAQLGSGAIYSVTLLGDPPCVLADAFGTVSGTIPLVQLACESVLLSALAIDGPAAPEIAFEPARRNYEGEVTILQQSVRIVATAALPGSTINVAGTPVESGVPSEPIELALGQNHIDIAVGNANGTQRLYRVSLQRAAEPAQYAYGKASNTGGADRFGTRVTIWGDTLAVGAPGEDSGASGVNGNANDDSLPNSGAVYVFRRIGSSWIQEAYLKASNPDNVEESGDFFGHSVALWEDTLVVGAPREDSNATGVDGDQLDNSAQDSGAVYVFRRNGNSWAQEAYLKASNTEPMDRFGHAVALGDDVLAVGAPGEDSGHPGVDADQSDNSMLGSGAVYVFRRDIGTWRQEAYVKASNPGEVGYLGELSGDQFGYSLTLWEDTLAVGAYGEDSSATGSNGYQDNNSATDSGAVYVFRRTDGLWAQEAYIKASNTDAGDHFGLAVSLWQDTLAVGAPLEDSAAAGTNGQQGNDHAPDSGAVYVFRRSGASWVQEAYIKASNTEEGDEFGASVAVHGQVLAVGADAEDSATPGVNGDQSNNLARNSGAAYLIHHSENDWIQKLYIKASLPDAAGEMEVIFGCFGRSLSLWADSLVVSAPYEDSSATGVNGDENDNSAANSGAVYMFH